MRPLSLGEVFDRAFSLYFKHIAAFTSLVAIVVLPMAVLSYLQSRDLIGVYVTLFQQAMQHPSKPPDVAALQSVQTGGPLLAVQYLLLFVGLPIAQAAVVFAVSKIYLGLPVDLAGSYRFALSRWLAILILIVLWTVIAVVAVVVVAIVFGFLSFVIGFTFVRAAGPNPFFAGSAAIFFIGCVVVGLGFGAIVYLASIFSFIAVVVEGADPVAAFASGFRRIFSSGQLWRAFAVALALFAINFGASLVTVGAGVIGVLLLKTPALYAISMGLLSLFFTPFAMVAAAVFYYDVRIRHEGYDLQMMAERFAAPAVTPVPSP